MKRVETYAQSEDVEDERFIEGVENDFKSQAGEILDQIQLAHLKQKAEDK
jgi:hypothetical protein